MISDHPQYPLVMTNIAIENGPVEIVDLPSKNGDLPVRYVAVYQRVPVMSSVVFPWMAKVVLAAQEDNNK